jgi:hypothetical protein
MSLEETVDRYIPIFFLFSTMTDEGMIDNKKPFAGEFEPVRGVPIKNLILH